MIETCVHDKSMIETQQTGMVGVLGLIKKYPTFSLFGPNPSHLLNSLGAFFRVIMRCLMALVLSSSVVKPSSLESHRENGKCRKSQETGSGL